MIDPRASTRPAERERPGNTGLKSGGRVLSYLGHHSRGGGAKGAARRHASCDALPFGPYDDDTLTLTRALRFAFAGLACGGLAAAVNLGCLTVAFVALLTTPVLAIAGVVLRHLSRRYAEGDGRDAWSFALAGSWASYVASMMILLWIQIGLFLLMIGNTNSSLTRSVVDL